MIALIAVLVVILVAVAAGLAGRAMSYERSSSHVGGHSPSAMSPPLSLLEIPSTGLVVADDHGLYAGTKQRGILPYFRALKLEKPWISTVLYTGTPNGYGPVAAALGASLSGLRCHLVLSLQQMGGARLAESQADKAPAVQKARALGATIEYRGPWRDATARGKALSGGSGGAVYWLPLGLKDSRFEAALARGLREAAPPGFAEGKRIWVVGGVGAVANALAAAYPRAEVVVVPAGSLKKLTTRASIFKGKAAPPTPTPYPTVVGYDSKAYDTAAVHGTPGDVVWNVAGGPARMRPKLLGCPAGTPGRLLDEAVRCESYRRLLAHVYLKVVEACPDTRKPQGWVPDMMSRWVFNNYSTPRPAGAKELLPSSEEAGRYAPSLAEHIARHTSLSEGAALRLAEGMRLGDRIRRVQEEAAVVLRKGIRSQRYNCATPADIPADVRAKLAGRWTGEGGTEPGTPGDPTTFEVAATQVYQRYATLGAVGHQLAMPDSAKQYLVERFGVSVETFASPINAGLPSYYSMWDIDSEFGSLGPFNSNFRERSPESVFMANPPYGSTALSVMVDAFLGAAATAAARSEEFLVMFGMPEWSNFPPLGRLDKDANMRLRVRFGDKEVTWVRTDGTLHRIPAHLWYVVSSRPLEDGPAVEKGLRNAWGK
jgi:hypothetical protein